MQKIIQKSRVGIKYPPKCQLPAVGEECIIFCPFKILSKKARVHVSYATRSDGVSKTTKNSLVKTTLIKKDKIKLSKILTILYVDHPFLYATVVLGSLYSNTKRFQMT